MGICTKISDKLIVVFVWFLIFGIAFGFSTLYLP